MCYEFAMNVFYSNPINEKWKLIYENPSMLNVHLWKTVTGIALLIAI